MLQNKKPSYIFTTTGKSISLLRKNFCIRAPRFLPAPRPSFCYLRGFWERKALSRTQRSFLSCRNYFHAASQQGSEERHFAL